MNRVVNFEIFRSETKSWSDLFNDASRFATEIGSENLINISHSWEGVQGIVTVWYWDDHPVSNVLGLEEE